jgi:hypothetical protein
LCAFCHRNGINTSVLSGIDFNAFGISHIPLCTYCRHFEMAIFRQARSEPLEADMAKIEPSLSTPPEMDADQMMRITLEAATLAKRALRAGSIAPPFRLRDYGGHRVSLQEISSTGPAIVLKGMRRRANA